MPYNVLIVDDSLTARGVIRRLLGLCNAEIGEIWEAKTGVEGLAVMRSQWVDLVLADLSMPDMTGQEMIEQMSRDRLLAKLPVIVVSSEGNQSILESLVRLGVRDIVRKPVSPALLRDTMEQVLGAASA